MKKWQWGLAILAGAAAIGVARSLTGTVVPAPQAPKTHAEAVRSSRLIERDTYAVVIAPEADRATVERKARDLCGPRQWCKVMGWTDLASVADAMPMTETEAEAIVMNLTINRATGLDEAVWTR